MCNKNPIIAIVGNKSDLYIREEVKEKEAKEYAKEIGAVFQLTSCLRSEGIRELMQAIGQKALGEIEQKESHEQGGIDISKEKKEKKMEQYLKSKEVAQMLGVSEIYLAKMRNSKYNTEKDGTLKKSFLPFYRVGRCVRYRLSDIENHIALNMNK